MLIGLDLARYVDFGGETAMPVQNLMVYSFENEQVFVCGVRANNCRVVKMNHRGEYFPESFLVPTKSLVEVSRQPIVNRERLQPSNKKIYFWKPPANVPASEFTPSDEIPHTHPKMIRVTRNDWQTSRVTEVDDMECPVSKDEFRVYNHHLLKD